MKTLKVPEASQLEGNTQVEDEADATKHGPVPERSTQLPRPSKGGLKSGSPRNGTAGIADVPVPLLFCLSAYALLGSVTTLVGWFGNMPRLTDWFGTGISMLPNTAVAGALISVGVLLSLGTNLRAHHACRALALVVTFIGGATLLEHLFGVDFGLDRLFIDPQWGERAATTIGRMGPPACASFLLLGSAFWLFNSRARVRRFVPFFGLATLAISSLGIVGYLFHADPLFAHARLTGTSLQTATILFALGVAVIARMPEFEPMRTLRRDTAAGVLVRRALPFTILLPITLCGLFVIGRNALWFDRGMGAAMLALALLALFCGLLWWCSRAVRQHESVSNVAKTRLESLLSLMPAAVYACDAKGRITFYNPRAAELWGRKPKLNDDQERFCAVYKCWFGESLIKPEQTPMATAVREGKAFRGLEAIFERPDGTKLPVMVNIDPVFDAERKSAGAINVFQDITPIKRAEAALRVQQGQLEMELADSKLLREISATLVEEDNVEVLYQKLLDAAVGVMHSDMASMQVVDEKADGLRMLAWRGFGPDFGEIFKLNGRATRTSCSLARETKRRVVMSDVETCDFVTSSPVALEGHLKTGIRAVQSTPLLSRSGKMVGMLSTHWRQPYEPTERDLRLLDILARQAADLLERRQVHEKVATLAAVVENSGDAIITRNLDGLITNWNKGAERIFGYQAEEIIGKPVAVLIPLERQDEESTILARLGAGERVDHYETVRKGKDGALIDISLTVSLIRDAEGKVIGASKIARDVTELRKARETLARSHQELEKAVTERTASLTEAIAQMEEFSYSVSHDLRAPVRAMQGYAKVALEDYGSVLEAQGREYLNRIVRSGERMDRLIRDILTYSRLSRLENIVQPVALDMLVRDIISHYPEMQAARAQITLAGEMGSVMAHEPSLTQAISNLLANAVKFVAPGVKPEVRVYSEHRGDRLRLWFHDNGIGISPEYQHRLFGLFERIHPTEPYEGTGIGLAVVRKSVERMGGKVGMESNGQGSKFWIELPAAQVQVS
jgi:PAS domain S-box-containing protein